ncbi:MAG: thioesterase family protein [Acidobacteriota bacterium]
MAGNIERSFFVRWADVDFNGHMRNTAYLDVSGDARMLYFEAGGFSMREFERLRLGPVIVRDEVEYFRELRLLEPFTVALLLAGASGDGSRFRLRNEFLREDGQPAARLTSTGGWMDLGARRWTTPPEALKDLVARLPRSDDFEVLATKKSR